MSEMTRLVRYIIPGTLAAVLVLLDMRLIDPDRLKEILSSADDVSDLVGALATVVVIPTTGYILSALHHLTYTGIGAVYSRLECSRLRLYPWPDPRDVLHYLIKHELLVVGVRTEDNIVPIDLQAEELTPRGAWRVLTAVWHELLASCKLVEGVESRTKALSNTVHGLGATTFAALLPGVFIAWYAPDRVQTETRPVEYLVLALLFNAVVAILTHVAYRNSLSDFQSVTDSTIVHALFRNRDDTKRRHHAFVTRNDIRNKRGSSQLGKSTEGS